MTIPTENAVRHFQSKPMPEASLKRLRSLVAQHGDYATVSLKTRIPLPTLQKIMRGASEPKFGQMIQMATSLGLSLDEIAFGKAAAKSSSHTELPVPPHIGLDQANQPDRTAFTAITGCKCANIDPRQIDWLFERIDGLEHRLMTEGRERKQLEAYVEQHFARQHRQNGLIADALASLSRWQDASDRWLTRIENTLAALPFIGKRFVKGRTGGAA